MAAGVEPGDRVGDLGAEQRRVGGRRRSAAIGAGGVLVPLNTRFKGAEAAYILERSGARLPVHRHRLPRHRLRRHAARRRSCPTRSSTSSCSAATPPDGHRSPGPTSSPARRRRRRPRRDAARRRGRARRRVRHHLHVGHHREAQGRDATPRADAARASTPGPNVVGLRAATATWSSTRSSTPSATRPASSPASSTGATIVPAAGVRRARGAGARRAPSASRCCPGRRRSTRRSSTTPTAAASTCRRCASRSPARPRCRSS